MEQETKEYQREWRARNKNYIKRYSQTRGKINSKKWYLRNRETILKKRRLLHKRDRIKLNKRCRDYYKKNRNKISEQKKKYFQNPEVKVRINLRQKESRKNPVNRYKNMIRDKTKHYFPLKGKNCEFCGDIATSHHHYTIPYEFDKFWYVCKECHLIKDKELKEYVNGNN